MSSRSKTILTHFASGVVGAIAGAALIHRLSVWTSHATAEVSVPVAYQALQAGNEDRAIVILSQATAEDPNYYVPFNLLGEIYLHRKNSALALEMYKRALEVFDRENVLSSKKVEQRERDSIRNNIDRLHDQLEVKPGGPRQK